jgi:hypothetical protein
MNTQINGTQLDFPFYIRPHKSIELIDAAKM